MHELSFTFAIEYARLFECNISCKEQTPTNKKEDANNEQPEHGDQDQGTDGTQENWFDLFLFHSRQFAVVRWIFGDDINLNCLLKRSMQNYMRIVDGFRCKRFISIPILLNVR